MRTVKIENGKITTGDEDVICPMAYNNSAEHADVKCYDNCAWFSIMQIATEGQIGEGAFCKTHCIGKVEREKL